MLDNEIEVGKTYKVKISGKLTHVIAARKSVYLDCWYGMNLRTRRVVRIKAGRFLGEATTTRPSRVPANNEGLGELQKLLAF